MFVIRLANLEAKPVANHKNTHPKFSLDVLAFNRHCATFSPAEPVSNLTPPGKFARVHQTLRVTARHASGNCRPHLKLGRSCEIVGLIE
jgi:hypothetical protein